MTDTQNSLSEKTEKKEEVQNTNTDKQNPNFFKDEADETVPYVKKSSLEPSSIKASHEGFKYAINHPGLPYRLVSQAALIRDRFAAFCIDHVILFYLFFLLKILILENISIPSKFPPWGFNLALFSMIAFIYFCFFELIAGASIGKWLCRLRVVDYQGLKPNLSSIFLRNLSRLFDYFLLGFIALLSMENSQANQRLGDRLAAVVVIKKTRKKLQAIDLRKSAVSFSFIRLCAFILDLIIQAVFFVLLLGTINPEIAQTKNILLHLALFISLFYYFIFEFFASSSPGKLIFSRQVVLENGEPLDATAAFIRNLCRPIDIFIAYPLLALSKRKQRLGDLICDTLVIKEKLSRNAKITLLNFAVILGVLSYFYFNNPQKNWFLKPEYLPQFNQINFSFLSPNIKNKTPKIEALNSYPQSYSLIVDQFLFSAAPDSSQIRDNPIFTREESIYLYFKIKGAALSPLQLIHLTEEIEIKNSEGITIYGPTTLVNYQENSPSQATSILFLNQITQKPLWKKGNYQISLNLKDENAKTQLKLEKNFTVQ